MARRKKPEEETVAETTERRIREQLSNAANRSEKTSWNRKMDNMVKLLAALRPIEDQIIELQAKKIPLFDEIQILRTQMVNECIHPYEYILVGNGQGLSLDEAICKFCNRKLKFSKFEMGDVNG